jgi:hypothetical protein
MLLPVFEEIVLDGKAFRAQLVVVNIWNHLASIGVNTNYKAVARGSFCFGDLFAKQTFQTGKQFFFLPQPGSVLKKEKQWTAHYYGTAAKELHR